MKKSIIKMFHLYKIRVTLSLICLVVISAFTFVVQKKPTHMHHAACGGIERWAIKVLIDSAAIGIDFNPIPITVDSLVHLQTPLVTASKKRIAGIEDRTYITQCRITIKKDEDDKDYHLVLSDGINTFIGELPDPICAAAASSSHVNEYIATRNFVDQHIASGDVKNIQLPDVLVTGVAFLDPPHGQTGAAPNRMELHPILDIKFAPGIGVEPIPSTKISVNIAPNPFNQEFLVQVQSNSLTLKQCRLELFDEKGVFVCNYELPIYDDHHILSTLNTEGLRSGSYIYHIISQGNSLYYGKVIKY